MNKTELILAGNEKLTPREQKVLVRRAKVALGTMDRIRKFDLMRLAEYSDKHQEALILVRKIRAALVTRGTPTAAFHVEAR